MAYSQVHSRHILGQLVFYDELYLHRWIDGIGPNVCKYLNDFVTYGEDWTETAVSNGTGTSVISSTAAEGGVLKISTSGSDNDGLQMQSQVYGYKLSTGDPLYFGSRFSLTGTTGYGSTDVMVGLIINDTSVIAGTTSGVYFQTADAANTLLGVCEAADIPTTTTLVTTGVVDTFYTAEFFWDGSTKVEFWLDGVSKGTETLSIPTTPALGVTIAYLNGAAHTDAVAGMNVDWVRCIQLLAGR